MYCKDCGTEISENSNFCLKCGAKVKYHTDIIEQAQEQIQQEEIDFNINEVKEEHQNSDFAPIWKFLLVIGIIAFVYYLLSDSPRKSNASSTDAVETPPRQRNENTIDFNSFAGKKFTFKSRLYDKEENGEIISTRRETTYHTFDFINKTVTQKSPLNGEWVTITYPVSGFYAQKGIAATTFVLVIGQLGVKEIWFSPDVENLGYDYEDGSRIACYELSNVN